MILVDTSVWIEILNGKHPRPFDDDLLAEFVTCGPVIQEVRQGLRKTRDEAKFLAGFGALPVIGEPIYRGTFVDAADIYRQGRQLGITIRSSTDCLIAAIAIEHSVPVWHRDRDFAAIARYTRLTTIDPLSGL